VLLIRVVLIIRGSPGQQSWMKRDVEILDVRLEDYIAALSEQVQALPPAGRRGHHESSA